MLNHLLAIAASSRYGYLIEVHEQSLTISNQHIFLWKALPKYAKSTVHKPRFIKQMRKIGFINVDQSHKNQISAKFNGPPFLINKIQQLIVIRQLKCEASQNLRQKAQIIAKLMQFQDCNKMQNLQAHFQLLQLIASLKQVNRTLYSLRTQQTSIATQSQQWLSQKLNPSANTEEMIYFQQQPKKQKNNSNNFYSFNILHS